MLEILQWLTWKPVVTISATAFYTFLVVCICVPSCRRIATLYFVPSTPSTHVSFDCLDTLRGLAASMVTLAHIWYFSHPVFDRTQQVYFHTLAVLGNKAVPVFVVLSSFLIYRSVLRINSRDELRKYALRRTLRVYPVYLFTLLIIFIMGFYTDIYDAVAQIFMIRVLNLAYIKYVNPPSWSLFVECLFYMIMPFFVAICSKRILLVSAILLAVFTLTSHLASREMWLWKYFLIGLICSEISRIHQDKINQTSAAAFTAIGASLLYIDAYTYKGGWYDYFNMLCIVPKNAGEYTIGLGIGLFFLILGLINSPQLGKLLAVRLGRALGAISYSVYLVSPIYIYAMFPEFDFINIVDHSAAPLQAPGWVLPFWVFPGVLAWGIVLFMLIERPFMNMRPR